MDFMSFQTAQDMQKSHPEILQIKYPNICALGIEPDVQKAPFNDIKVRQAMQMAINLPQLASSYYAGSCSPYPSSITSNTMSGYGFPYDQWPQDLKDQYAFNPTAAKKLLADAGYPTGFTTTLIADVTADLDLMQVIKSYFADISITMNIQVMDDPTFTSFVKTGHKNTALAARPSCFLGRNTAPIGQMLSFYTGNYYNVAQVSDPIWDAFYNGAVASNSLDVGKQMLAQANKYAAEQHFNISLVQPNLFALVQPWFKGYDAQLLGISGPSGPQDLAFYGARYWIDGNLKKSMGK